MKTKYSVCHQIKAAMRIKNISQAELCRKTGINKASMSQYVSGEFVPKTDRIHLLANALDVNPIWLAGYDVPMEKLLTKSELSIADAQLIIDFENDPKNQKFILNFIRLSESQKEAVQNIVFTMVGE